MTNRHPRDKDLVRVVMLGEEKRFVGGNWGRLEELSPEKIEAEHGHCSHKLSCTPNPLWVECLHVSILTNLYTVLRISTSNETDEVELLLQREVESGETCG